MPQLVIVSLGEKIVLIGGWLASLLAVVPFALGWGIGWAVASGALFAGTPAAVAVMVGWRIVSYLIGMMEDLRPLWAVLKRRGFVL